VEDDEAEANLLKDLEKEPADHALHSDGFQMVVSKNQKKNATEVKTSKQRHLFNQVNGFF